MQAVCTQVMASVEAAGPRDTARLTPCPVGFRCTTRWRFPPNTRRCGIDAATPLYDLACLGKGSRPVSWGGCSGLGPVWDHTQCTRLDNPHARALALWSCAIVHPGT